MQQSGGLLLMPGSTGMTPLFLPFGRNTNESVRGRQKETIHSGGFFFIP